ncbi:site-specific integrase [Bradyrhizobium zhanjiangense]|uniref:site-specific integrase n=1 Tax=Bradyrhizobium zhanjiangense TaxID=1325107 RepID=UPI001FDEFC52|nr:site-specific integrase [Bradyrhizobium zhanjiangense]
MLTEGQRNAIYVKGDERRARKYLIPFFGKKGLSEITDVLVNEYRISRIEQAKEQRGKPTARATMHQEIVCLRQILKTALRHQWLTALPDLSEPYRKNGKISIGPGSRAMNIAGSISDRAEGPEAQEQQVEVVGRAVARPHSLHEQYRAAAGRGQAPPVRDVDVTVAFDEGTRETILEIEGRGKRGYGPCKSTQNAVPVFERLKKRNKPQPTDLIFPKYHREMFTRILQEEGLKFDREGRPRTLYSLRHTYICFRLMEGADIYMLAKN